MWPLQRIRRVPLTVVLLGSALVSATFLIICWKSDPFQVSRQVPSRVSFGDPWPLLQASDIEVSLEGAWLFGEERSECYISRTEGNQLRFGVPLPQGQTAFGMLQPTKNGWMQAELNSNSGEQVGTIRLRLEEPTMLTSNFKYPGETAWGKSTTARKTEAEGNLDDRVPFEELNEEKIDAAVNRDRKQVRAWQVITQHGLNVRAMSNTSSAKLGTKWEGATVWGHRHGVWLELVHEPGYMLIADHGEVLLRRMPGASSSQASTTTLPQSEAANSVKFQHEDSEQKVKEWVVVTANGMFVREDMSKNSLVLGTKVSGSTVRGRQIGRWIKLTSEPGFMMVSADSKAFMAEVTTTPTTTPKMKYCHGQDCMLKPPSLQCLDWNPEGCQSVSTKDGCLNSLDGRRELALGGRKVHGQPCVWCGGAPCSGTSHYCEPFDTAVNDPRWSSLHFEVASCQDSDKQSRPTLFCYSLMMPSGYELQLVRAQVKQAVGIFGCDGFAIFSNRSISVGLWNGTGTEVVTVSIPGSLSVPKGGKWFTALNTGVFLRVWRALVAHGGFLEHDWTVKADPDCVFFPERLRDVLQTKPMSSVPLLQRDPDRQCGNCSLQGHSDELCSSRISSLEIRGHTCEEALLRAGRPWPQDCACNCGSSSCSTEELPGAMFMINCRYGLHGPIEVLSRDALRLFSKKVGHCEVLRKHPWGEDKYLDHCLQRLGVRRVMAYELLDETACGKTPVHCASPNVGFHPFKDIQSYFDCWGLAAAHGKWPPRALDKPAKEDTRLL